MIFPEQSIIWAVQHNVWLHLLTLGMMHLLCSDWSILVTWPQYWPLIGWEVSSFSLILMHPSFLWIRATRCNRKRIYVEKLYVNRNLSSIINYNPIIAKWIWELFKANLTLLGCLRAASIGSSLQWLQPSLIWLQSIAHRAIPCLWLVKWEAFCQRMWIIQGQVKKVEKNTKFQESRFFDFKDRVQNKEIGRREKR